MKSNVMKQFLQGSGSEDKEEMALQITSMADIFTIILIFLLKSFSTGMTTINPPQGMVLPSVTSQTRDQLKESIKVEIMPNSILVDSKQIMKIENFIIEEEGSDLFSSMMVGEIATVGQPVSMKLVEVLSRERAKSLAEGPSTRLTILSHENAPYSTVRTVVNSAASAGYADLQLVVVGAVD